MNNLGDSRKEDVCKTCDPGYACFQRKGVIKKMCDEGYLCTIGALTNKPNGFKEDGIICAPGTYCKMGANNYDKCDPG